MKYGFLSVEISNTGRKLLGISVGDRVFCHISAKGFVGMGLCTAAAVPMKDFMVPVAGGNAASDADAIVSISEVLWEERELKAQCMGNDEWFIGVKWMRTVDVDDGFWEKGLKTVPLAAYESKCTAAGIVMFSLLAAIIAIIITRFWGYALLFCDFTV